MTATPRTKAGPWQFFVDHPLPWQYGEGSPGAWVEDASGTVLWRFDHFDKVEARAFVEAINAVVSTEEAPYIRGFNRGWAEAATGSDGLTVERLGAALKVELNRPHRAGHYLELAAAILTVLAQQQGEGQQK